jgi:hypothetical protein
MKSPMFCRILRKRRVFIVEGLITVASALVAKLVLVDWPEDGHFLSEDEKKLLASRLSEDQQEAKMDRLDKQAVKSIFTDWKLYCT